MIKLLELHPVRVATREIILPGPVQIAETLKIAKSREILNRSGKKIMCLDSSSYITAYLEEFKKAGYIHIRKAFEKLNNIGLLDVTEVEFWDACIRMGKEGIAETVEIADFNDFTE